jgi:FkbM family methyltransferase
MNRGLTARIDAVSPSVSVRLRLLQKRLRNDVTLALIKHLVREGDGAVDVGAHRGTYTLALSSRVGRGGQVWSIEPFPPNAAAVARVAQRRSNITVCPVAASDRSGQGSMHVPVYQGRTLGALSSLGYVDVRNSADVANDDVVVELQTIDQLLSSGGGQQPITFLRCDVVGHEAAVLAGSIHTLTVWRPALFVEIEQRHQRAPITETFDYLAGLGYTGYFVSGRDLRPLTEFDLDRDQLSLVPATFVPYDMPEGYVHYFLFLPSERPPPVLPGVS